jgi:hypothetical protein
MLIAAFIIFLALILVLYLINRLPIGDRAKLIARIVAVFVGVFAIMSYIAPFWR